MPVLKNAERIDTQSVKAYLVYAAAYEALVLSVCAFLPGPVGHNMAQNWVLALALLVAPIPRLGLGFFWALQVHVAVLIPAFAAHTLVAFVGRAHEAVGPLQLIPFAASLFLYAVAAALSSTLARKADTRFRIAWPRKTAEAE